MQPARRLTAFAERQRHGKLRAMKTVTVQELPQVLGKVLAWLKAGESVELREEETRVGTIQPERDEADADAWRKRREWVERLRKRSDEIFGDTMLTAEESAFIRDRGDY